MAQKLTDDTLRWTLEINGKPAQKQLSILEQNTYNLQKANKSLGTEMAKLEAQGKKNTDEYKALDAKMKENNRTINQSEAQMKQLRGEIGITGMTTRQLRKHMNDLKQQLDNAVPNTAIWRKHRAELQAAQTRYGQLNTSMQQTNGVLGLTKKALGFIGFAAVTAAASRLMGKMVGVRSEFEKYEAVLSNSLESQKAANSEMAMIKKFAAETPFEVDNLTDAFVRMVNQGFQPTKGEMRKMGDLASSTGKNFLQLTEAILDAQVGEFERLKEFGIKAKKEGDNVTFSFKGVTTTVKASSEAIRGYILSLGDMRGVAGSMAKISQTLGGKISNMSDSYGALLNKWGSQTGGAIGNAISWITRLMTKLATVSLSKELNDEQMAVNRLVYELNDANTKGDRRIAIVTELKELAPDIVKSLDDEGVATLATAEALRVYNQQMINKIILSKNDEKMQGIREKMARFSQKQYEFEAKVSNDITKQIQNTKDLAKAEEYRLIMADKSLTLMEKANKIQSLSGGSSVNLQELENYAQRLKDLNGELETLSGERVKMYDRFGGDPFVGDKAKEEAARLEKEKRLKEAAEKAAAEARKIAAEAAIKTNKEVEEKMSNTLQTESKKRILLITEEYLAGKRTKENADAETFAEELAYIQAAIGIKKKYKQDSTDLEIQYQEKLRSITEEYRAYYKKMDEENQKAIDDSILESLAKQDAKFDAEIEAEKAKTQKIENLQRESYEKEQILVQKKAALYQDLINQLSGAIYDFTSNSEDGMRDFSKAIVNMALDLLKSQVEIAIAGVTIQSLASAESVATYGAAGLAKAALLVGLIEAAFAGVKGLVNSGIDKSFDKKQGKNLWDGGFTPNGAWNEPQGVVHSNEWVGSRFAVTNPHVKQFLDVFDMAQRTGQIRSLNTRAIMAAVDAKQGGYAAGGYAPTIQQSQAPMIINTDPELKAIIAEIARMMAILNQKLDEGFNGTFSYTQFEKIKKEVEDIRNKTTMS